MSTGDAPQEATFGPTIVRDRSMEIQVLMGDIRHDADVELSAVQPVQFQAVGGGLDDNHVDAVVSHLSQVALDVQ